MIKIGSGDTATPDIWTNDIRQESAVEDTIHNTIPTIIPVNGGSVYVCFTTYSTDAWVNNQKRVAFAEFDQGNGELLTCRTIGDDADLADFSNGAGNYVKKIGALDNTGQLVLTGIHSGTSTKQIYIDPSDYSLDGNIDINQGFVYNNVCCNTGNGYNMLWYSGNNYVEVTQGNTTTSAEGGVFSGFTDVHDAFFSGSTYITGMDSAGGVDKCGVERYNNSYTSTADIKFYDPAFATTGDEHKGLAITVDASSNVYVAWQAWDASTNSYYDYVSKLPGSLASVSWTKKISSSGNSFTNGRQGPVTICMSPDDANVYTCWYKGTTMSINGLAASNGAEVVDLKVQGNTRVFSAGAINADDNYVYLAARAATSSGQAKEHILIMQIDQTNFEAWTTENYGGFNGQGSAGFGNTSITPTTASLSATGIGGTSTGPYTSDSDCDIDTETIDTEIRITY